MQTSMYSYSETSSAYNTMNHCQSSKDHIYESTCITGVTVPLSDEKANNNGIKDHNHFAPESGDAQSD